ncbi:MAG: GFA family protein [Hyphomonadaceae bacterium]
MTQSHETPKASGRCACGAIQFQMHADPIITHACHCTWCQRETGGAFAVNALIETDQLRITAGEPVAVDTPSASGRGQTIVRCPKCHVAVWSHYPGGGPNIAFVRVGVLEPGHGIRPDAHIFTSTKAPWLPLPDDAPAFEAFYDPAEVWSPAARQRYAATR